MFFKNLLIIPFILFATFLFSCATPVQENKSLPKSNGGIIENGNLDSSLDSIVNQLVTANLGTLKPRMTVVDFTNVEGGKSEFGQFISEALITRLFKTGRFEVLERRLIKRLIQEHTLNMSGYINEDTAIEAGQLLGVDLIVAGTITDLIQSINVNARLISIGTGSVLATASANIQKNEVITKLLSNNNYESSFDKVKGERKNFEPCGISLKSISKTAGFSGEVIGLFGQWGDSQGGKLPTINKGRPNNLEVISWSNSTIKVKIPQDLGAGDYKVGVYCNDPAKGRTYSSGWIKFEIVSSPPKPTYPPIKGGYSTISFISYADKSRWIKDVSNVKWAVAISNNDIVKVSYSNGKAYNKPNLLLSEIDQYVIINGMENNVLRTTNVMPGTYDWIILLDHNDDGISDSYLGTIEKNIKLNRMKFLPGEHYKITVTNDGRAFLSVE